MTEHDDGVRSVMNEWGSVVSRVSSPIIVKYCCSFLDHGATLTLLFVYV